MTNQLVSEVDAKSWNLLLVNPYLFYFAHTVRVGNDVLPSPCQSQDDIKSKLHYHRHCRLNILLTTLDMTTLLKFSSVR